MLSAIDVDLSHTASVRWVLSPTQVEWARSLVATKLGEIGGVEPYRELVEVFVSEHLGTNLREELEGLAERSSLSFWEVVTANLYYDFIKLVLGCSAFAVDTPKGPLHARNMDWVSENNSLSEFTTLVTFRGPNEFRSVGWPGYVGVLSGVAEGRFAITLNASLSNEPPVMASSIAFLIRETFETCSTYEQAIDKLASTTITSDCLLLVTGPDQGQMVVIERTPTRSALRHPESGYLVLTNDYRVLDRPSQELLSELQLTTCTRFEGVAGQLGEGSPTTADECFRVLDHELVRMVITVQQMVFSARTGEVWVRTK